jgi:hypothetical protein
MAKGKSLFWHSRASGYHHPVLGNFFRHHALNRNNGEVLQDNIKNDLSFYNCKIVTDDTDLDIEGGVAYSKKTLVFESESNELLFILKWSGND